MSATRAWHTWTSNFTGRVYFNKYKIALTTHKAVFMFEVPIRNPEVTPVPGETRTTVSESYCEGSVEWDGETMPWLGHCEQMSLHYKTIEGKIWTLASCCVYSNTRLNVVGIRDHYRRRQDHNFLKCHKTTSDVDVEKEITAWCLWGYFTIENIYNPNQTRLIIQSVHVGISWASCFYYEFLVAPALPLP